MRIVHFQPFMVGMDLSATIKTSRIVFESSTRKEPLSYACHRRPICFSCLVALSQLFLVLDKKNSACYVKQ